MDLSSLRILTLPGWGNSGLHHWQTRWQAAFGHQRVEQADWEAPTRPDWVARLEHSLQTTPQPSVLVAHSLGCHLVAHWAAAAADTRGVRAAFLVAPPDVARVGFPPSMQSWRTEARQRLPFPTLVVYSSDDPYASSEHALGLARSWGADTFCVGAAGHINADSGLGDWPEGLRQFHALIARIATTA
mgnify:CR=1 FL=1